MQLLVFAIPLVILAWTGLAHRFMFDDGYIYLRVVKQIRVGHGPVYNTGQRVEAFTSPLWVAILAVADLVLPLGLQWIAILFGVGCTVAGAAFAMRASAILNRRAVPDAFLIPVGVVVFAALLPVWYFESAGLETGLTFLWFGASAWILAKWAGDPTGRLSGPAAIVLGLGWLTRPELVVASVVFLVTVSAAQWRTATWRQRVEVIVWMTAIPVAYEMFRMGYYGSLVANTAVAKEGSRLRAGTGWQYMLDFVAPYRLWLPIALLVGAIYVPLALQLKQRGESRSVLVLCAFFVSAVGCAIGVIGFGGDYLHGRLLLSAFFALCAPVAVVAATKRYATTLVILGWAAICAFAFRPPELRTGLHFRDGIAYGFPSKSCCGDLTLTASGWGPTSPHRRAFDTPAVYVTDQSKGFGTTYNRVSTPLAPDIHLPTIVSGGIGILGYALGPRATILDINGLADPIAAHLKLARRGYPGHEKELPAAWAAALVTANNSTPRAAEFQITPQLSTPADSNVPFDQQVADARTALDCPALRGLRHSVDAHLSLHLFISNIVHSFSRTALRIPSDPRDAAARFCAHHPTPVSQAEHPPAQVRTLVSNPAIVTVDRYITASPLAPAPASALRAASSAYDGNQDGRVARAPP